MRWFWYLLISLVVLALGVLLWPKKAFGPTAQYEPTISPASPKVVANPPTKKSTTFTIGGDIMLDRMVYHTFKNTAAGSATAFAKLDSSLFANSDLRLANLEGPISANPIDDDITANNLVFNFPPDTVAVLQSIHLNAVSLANNHTGNKGKAGLDNTRAVLTAGQIQPIGQQVGFMDSNVWRATAGTLPVTIITIDTLEDYDTAALTNAIKSEHAAGQFVFIWPHWGNEYQTHHSQNQHDLAASWVAAGAGLIIGGHPHVVQDAEIIDRTPVIYSIGNFVFDQTFSAETQQGVIVSGTITSDKIELTIHPISLKGMQPKLLTGQERQPLLDRILTPLNVKESDTISIPR